MQGMFGRPSTEEIMSQILMEYGPNSPRARMTVAAYLIENDAGPSVIGDKAFVDAGETVITFVMSGLDALRADLAALEPNEVPEKDAEEGTDEEPEDQSGYAYL